MAHKYLLPCRCGQQHVVELRQSGGTISCPCGGVLQIPTLLEMKALEPVPEESNPPSDAVWGARQVISFLGLLGLLFAIIFGVLVWLAMKPVPPIDVIDPEKIQQSAQQLPPLRTWVVWEGMKKQGLGFTDTRYADELLKFRIFLGATIVLALIGVVLITIGMSRPKPGKPPSVR